MQRYLCTVATPFSKPQGIVKMSIGDAQFIKGLGFMASDVARILNISRQSVSRGIRSDKDYLDQAKVMRISDAAQKIFGREQGEIDRLIHKFYPYHKADLRRLAVAEAINLSVDGDIYLSCTRLPYYMSIYGRLFADLAAYVRATNQQTLFFTFPDPDTFRYSRDKLIKWIGDDRAISHSYVIICREVAIFPFAVCGYGGNKPVVYFCDADGFAAQNENNSRLVLNFLTKYIDDHRGLLKKLA
jgi:hypothetical protein